MLTIDRLGYSLAKADEMIMRYCFEKQTYALK